MNKTFIEVCVSNGTNCNVTPAKAGVHKTLLKRLDSARIMREYGRLGDGEAAVL